MRLILYTGRDVCLCPPPALHSTLHSTASRPHVLGNSLSTSTSPSMMAWSSATDAGLFMMGPWLSRELAE